MQKNGNFTSEPCDKADDAKYSFRRGALNEKYSFSNGIWKFQVAINGAKRVHTGVLAGPKRHIFHEFVLAAFKIMVPTEGGEHFFEKCEDIL